MISLKQLSYALAVEQTRHFKKAARLCTVSQSALSTAISELEAQSASLLLCCQSQFEGRDLLGILHQTWYTVARAEDLQGIFLTLLCYQLVHDRLAPLLAVGLAGGRGMFGDVAAGFPDLKHLSHSGLKSHLTSP